MKNSIVIYPLRGKGYASGISFPKALVESFRELFLHQDDRSWQDPLWCFKRKFLDQVRTWAREQANEQGLTLHDLTELPKTKREALLKEIQRQEYEEHVSAMIEMLPHLPSKALRVSHWWPTHLILDLQIYVERSLFEQLKQATWSAGFVPRTPYIAHQRSKESHFYALPDPRIIHQLMKMHIENFSVQILSHIQSFENGTIHGYDEQGKLWFGAPYQVIGTAHDFMVPAGQTQTIEIPYTVMSGDNEVIYLVAQAANYLHQYCQHVAPAIVSQMSPSPPSRVLAEFIQHYHLTDWFLVHVDALCTAAKEAFTPASFATSHADLWRIPRYWIHPADALLHYLDLVEREPLLHLLGWDEQQFREVQGRVSQEKELYAENYYQYCKEHAVMLMQERFRGIARSDIQELAQRYGLVLSLGKKEKMVQACTDQRIALDFIGVTEEQQRRSTSFVDIDEGIPWGKRSPGDLYSALRRGYLSDGSWSISELRVQGTPWFALWRGWPPQAEVDRNRFSPYTWIDQYQIDLEHCRWVAYRRGEVPTGESVSEETESGIQ